MEADKVVAKLLVAIAGALDKSDEQLVVMNREIGMREPGFAIIDRSDNTTLYVTVSQAPRRIPMLIDAGTVGSFLHRDGCAGGDRE